MTPELKKDLKMIGFWSKPQIEKGVYTNIDVKLLMRIRDVKNGACINCFDPCEAIDLDLRCPHCKN